ncbi:MAG: RNA 2',3'-cyclic phosphodiesterase [Deltaproteobacteria bacterium]|nr:RNA 2',3'-cyclic phosphodiesterase [Deltaproteobacteria bacterium]
MSVRAFVALELPEPVRDALAAAAESAKAHAPGKLSWTAIEKLHLTLVFLGASEPEKLTELQKSLDEEARATKPFSLALAGPGVFPSPRKPSVLWIGLQPSPELVALQAGVAKRCQALGWTLEDRAYAAHLTLARVKFAGPPGKLWDAWKDVKPPELRWDVHELTLMRSDTTPGGAVYSALGRSPLGR